MQISNPFLKEMYTQTELLAFIEKYQKKYPGETGRVLPVKAFIENTDNALLYSRHNFIGHITASAFIYHQALDAVLLIKHKVLNRWLQPGGHIEPTDKNLVSAALREAEEETGIPADSLVVSSEIFDIDSHAIPANEKKKEPAHVHHDFRYLLLYIGVGKLLSIQPDVAGCEWVSLSQLSEQPGFNLVVQKLELVKHNL